MRAQQTAEGAEMRILLTGTANPAVPGRGAGTLVPEELGCWAAPGTP